jgi:geranylgeranyl diphosphate synthase type I
LNTEGVKQQISDERKSVLSYLDSYLDEWEGMRDDSTRWRKDTAERMSEMVKRGKIVRGALVLKTCRMYGNNECRDAEKVAGAIELLHTGLLMHDDIIDRDDYRRGIKTFSRQYRELAEEEEIDSQHHFGIGMAMTAGDIGYFMGQGLLSKIESDPKTRKEITELVFSEFSSVGLAEQIDIYSGYSTREASEEEIMQLYRDKTARYTFSLPMKAGALLADVEEDEIQRLYELGEKIGIIFQLRDDELELFGEEEETGKSLGSDLEENKKTLHRLKLLEKLPEEEAKEMKERLRGDLSRQDKIEIRDRMEETGVRKEVRDRMEELAEETHGRLDDLDAPEPYRKFLSGMIDFCLYRDK